MYLDSDLNELDFQSGLSSGRSKVTLCKSACQNKTDTGLLPVQNRKQGANCVSHAMRGKRKPPKTRHNEPRQIKDQMRGSDKEKCGDEGAQFGNVTCFRET